MKRSILFLILVLIFAAPVFASGYGNIKFIGPYKHYLVLIDWQPYEPQTIGINEVSMLGAGEHSVIIKTHNGKVILDKKIDVSENKVTKIKVPRVK